MIPKGPDFSLSNRFGGTPPIPACEWAHVDTVKLLLTTKIDVNHIKDLGWTCLPFLGTGGRDMLKSQTWFSLPVLIRT